MPTAGDSYTPGSLTVKLACPANGASSGTSGCSFCGTSNGPYAVTVTSSSALPGHAADSTVTTSTSSSPTASCESRAEVDSSNACAVVVETVALLGDPTAKKSWTTGSRNTRVEVGGSPDAVAVIRA